LVAAVETGTRSDPTAEALLVVRAGFLLAVELRRSRGLQVRALPPAPFPLLGQDVISTGIRNTQTPVEPAWSVWPNPATDAIRLSFPTDNQLHYRIYGITGQTVKEGYANSGAAVEIADLIPGAYYVTIHDGSAQLQPIKIIKL
jgi:hypothetical protein